MKHSQTTTILHTGKTGVVLVAALLLTCGSLHAQHRRHDSERIITAYPAVGATASQIRGDELRGFRKWGFTAGVGADIALSKEYKIDLTIEADYSQRGSYNNTSDPYALFFMTLNYVDIPVSLLWTDPWGGMTFQLGLTYSRLVQQPNDATAISTPNYFVPDTSDMTFLRNDLAVAIGCRIPVWRGLMLDLRWQHSIIPVKKDWQFTEYNTAFPNGVQTWSNDCYNSSIMIRLIYLLGNND